MTCLSQIGDGMPICDNAVFVSPTFGNTLAYMEPTILVVPTESQKLQRAIRGSRSVTVTGTGNQQSAAGSWG